MSTLRQTLVTAINELNKVLPVIANEPQHFSSLILRRSHLQQQLILVVTNTLTANDVELKNVLASLEEVTEIAKRTQKDISQINRLIDKTTKAVTAVEKLVKGVREII